MVSAGAVQDSPDGKPTKQHWKWAALASMASYIDAGSIVAAAAGLPLWEKYLGLNSTVIGLLTAFSSNAISAAIGALIGGRLGDLFGRKRIYAWDLLVFAFGILWIVFATNLPMLFTGYVIVGLAVGADLPTSLALVAEFSPGKSRGKLIGLTQVAWSLGPMVTLVLAFTLAPLGMLGIRLVFAHLFVAAIVTWYLRRGMVESAHWAEATKSTADGKPVNPLAMSRLRDLFKGKNAKALWFTGSVYVLWNMAAGTNGAFLPYILQRAGSADQATSVAIQSLSFGLTLLAVVFVFMPVSDTRNRRPMFIIGAVMQVIALGMFTFFPISIMVALTNVVLFGIGAAVSGESFYKLWSQEMFPTVLRGTAQGLTFAVARIVLGVWSFLVPIMLSSTFGLSGMSAIMMGMLVVFGVIGTIFMPNAAGKSLHELDREHLSAMPSGNPQEPDGIASEN